MYNFTKAEIELPIIPPLLHSKTKPKNRGEQNEFTCNSANPSSSSFFCVCFHFGILLSFQSFNDFIPAVGCFDIIKYIFKNIRETADDKIPQRVLKNRAQ